MLVTTASRLDRSIMGLFLIYGDRHRRTKPVDLILTLPLAS